MILLISRTGDILYIMMIKTVIFSLLFPIVLLQVVEAARKTKTVHVYLQEDDQLSCPYRIGDKLEITANVSKFSIADFVTNGTIIQNGSLHWSSYFSVFESPGIKKLSSSRLTGAVDGKNFTVVGHLLSGLPSGTDKNAAVTLKLIKAGERPSTKIPDDDIPSCQKKGFFSFVTGNDSLLHLWHQAHEDFRLQYKPNDTLSGEWEVSGLTAPNFVIITDSMTIPITNGSQYWGSTFHVAKNESCIALFVESLTPEADNKSISLVDKLQGDKSPEKEYPSVILTEITSAAFSVAGGVPLLLLLFAVRLML